MLTKKDFIKFAATQANIQESPEKELTIKVFIDVAKTSNPRFDEQRFRKACVFNESITHLNNCLKR